MVFSTSKFKLSAKCVSISDFLFILKNSVEIDGKKQLALPKITNHKVCTNCGSIYHQKKDCFSQQSCLRCALPGHHIEECKSDFEKCINCNEDHMCFSDNCEKYAQKKFKINRYVLSILKGENLISSLNDILNRKNSLLKKFNLNRDRDTCDGQMNTIVNSKLQTYFAKMENVEQKISEQFLFLKSSKEGINSIRSTIYENASDLDSIKNLLRESSEIINQIRPQIETAQENINNFKKSLKEIDSQIPPVISLFETIRKQTEEHNEQNTTRKLSEIFEILNGP
ncbi:unnamed protein product [Brachionus calyciflorus]|uniref:CCHC-type domain-containing protein n=1 Tax=Brachionus calyciflorus TaxID=104777 RepID=A0A814CVN3_9BILA|nr:unnamed protein product [Brachionus calyciflorus]